VDELRDEILGVLEELRQVFRDEGFGEAEDRVLDDMDRVTGWCCPRMRLFVGS